MSSNQHICMLAAENGAIPGAKVGGIGDVVRDIPRALARLSNPDRSVSVSVVIPAYGSLHLFSGSEAINTFTARFRDQSERIELFEIYREQVPGVRYLLLHHPLFAAGGVGRIYCNDQDDQPFATDASKFALFTVAAITAIKEGLIGSVDTLHLHDWHTALATALIRFDDAFSALRSIPCVYSIHNLALQGIRPFKGDISSLQSWYPHLHYDPALLADPRWPHCINPMAAAIRMAARVHTVSPNYATEVVQPDDQRRGFHGGEGLELDLQAAAQQQRLVGIINGIDYDTPLKPDMTWPTLMQTMASELLGLISAEAHLRGCDYLAHQRLLHWQQAPAPEFLVTSVGRLTDQKMALLLKRLSDGRTALEHVLDQIDNTGLFILLGTGDPELERQCHAHASRSPQMIFINHYSDSMSAMLFQHGHLFMMPSLFEPCGISQMLAMRSGQPVLAHAVGGLVDTINDDSDGFLFTGESLEDKSHALVKRFRQAITLHRDRPEDYVRISRTAAAQRFDWQESAGRYIRELYS